MPTHFGDGRDWFFERRFGLFVHWGLYAIPAWHEQHQYRLNIPRREYEQLIHRFNPVRYDPDAWLDLAEATGMRYICFTTKHIDGFCLWNTAQTPYNVMHTPYGRDVLGMLAEACHRRGFPLCLYYSIADMHHPNYPTAGRRYERRAPEPDDAPDLAKYLAFVRAQVRELCTNYGEIHGFWWDANVLAVDEPILLHEQDPSFNAMIRSLQPNAVINGRGFDPGDFSTPERDWDDSVNIALAFERPTEACQSIGTESWGYRADEDYYSYSHLIRSIDKVLAKGGNYLLNAGPMADGTFPPEAVQILGVIGDWYRRVGEAFDHTTPCSELVENRNVLLTGKGNVLYVHLNKEPVATSVVLKPLARLPRRATLLNNGAEVEARVELIPSGHHEGKPYLRLRNLPVNAFAGSVLVVKLEFDRPIEELQNEHGRNTT
jgi:alpha-L-fucosidase